MKHTVTIEIAGTKYKLTSDAEPDQLRRLADVINARIEDMGPAAQRSASPAQLLAMVALSLAEDLEAAEARRLRAEARVREVITQTIERIDERLAELASGR
ncbi:MAG: cell division protein ZapA [Myxococcales bacterium]|nr:cell division protein ZapA [Myxococcales bacterium]